MADTPPPNDDAKPYYVFPDASGADALFFPSRDAFGRWYAGQVEKWRPITELKSENFGSPLRQIFDANRKSLKRFLTAADQLSAEDSAERRANLQNTYKDIAIDRRVPVLAPEYPDFLNELMKSHSPQVAAAAFSANGNLIDPNNGTPVQMDRPDLRLGMMANTAYYLGLGSAPGQATQTLLQNLGRQYEAELARIRSSVAEFQNERAALIKDAHEALKKGRQEDRASADQSVAEFEITAANAVESINSTEAAFKEKMRLQASVTYWTDQATKHRKSESAVRRTLFGYMILGVPALIFAIGWIAHLAGDAQGPTANIQYAKYAFIGLLTTSLMFWIGRLLLKVMLSERHLAIDAEERTTMVMTYLALTDAGKLEAADRGLALNALFRSGSDGIVKDDAAPDSQIAALLARISNLRGS